MTSRVGRRLDALEQEPRLFATVPHLLRRLARVGVWDQVAA